MTRTKIRLALGAALAAVCMAAAAAPADAAPRKAHAKPAEPNLTDPRGPTRAKKYRAT